LCTVLPRVLTVVAFQATKGSYFKVYSYKTNLSLESRCALQCPKFCWREREREREREKERKTKREREFKSEREREREREKEKVRQRQRERERERE